MKGAAWSDVEDDAIRTFYPSHGMMWEGWDEVLPGRTTYSIQNRARRLGVKSLIHHHGRKRNRPKGDSRHYTSPSTTPTRDPYESQVMRYMNDGMTPTEIDRKMGWYPGSARLILSNRWQRKKEEAIEAHEDFRGRDFQ